MFQNKRPRISSETVGDTDDEMPLASDVPQNRSETPPRDILPPLPTDPLDFVGKDAPAVRLFLFYLLFFIYFPG